MIYETISDGNHAFSSDLMATCNQPSSYQYLCIFCVTLVNFFNISFVPFFWEAAMLCTSIYADLTPLIGSKIMNV